MKIFYTLLLTGLMTCAAHAQVPGDLDGDNKVTVSDITELINIYLNADDDDSGYKAIDLGLSVKWANMNVGANSPEEYGDYYAWGWPYIPQGYTIRYCPWLEDWGRFEGYYSDWTKYCVAGYGYSSEDGITQVELLDDAAYVNMGEAWRTPTREEAQELFDECTWKWTTQNKVKGYRVTGPNGKSIFLPAGGGYVRNSNEHRFVGECGYYQTSTLTEYSSCGFSIWFNDWTFIMNDTAFRNEGLSVRGVQRNDIVIQKMGDLDGDGSVTVEDIVMLISTYLDEP